MSSSQDQWQFVEQNQTKNRKCSNCGADYKTKCILETEPNVYHCTQCILSDSDKKLAKCSLSGNYSFIYGDLSMTDFIDMLDDAEEDLEDLEYNI